MGVEKLQASTGCAVGQMRVCESNIRRTCGFSRVSRNEKGGWIGSRMRVEVGDDFSGCQLDEFHSRIRRIIR